MQRVPSTPITSDRFRGRAPSGALPCGRRRPATLRPSSACFLSAVANGVFQKEKPGQEARPDRVSGIVGSIRALIQAERRVGVKLKPDLRLPVERLAEVLR